MEGCDEGKCVGWHWVGGAGRGTLEWWPTCRRPTPRIRWPPTLPTFLPTHLPTYPASQPASQIPTGTDRCLPAKWGGVGRGRGEGGHLEAQILELATQARWSFGLAGCVRQGQYVLPPFLPSFLPYIHSRRRAEECTRPPPTLSCAPFRHGLRLSAPPFSHLTGLSFSPPLCLQLLPPSSLHLLAAASYSLPTRQPWTPARSNRKETPSSLPTLGALRSRSSTLPSFPHARCTSGFREFVSRCFIGSQEVQILGGAAWIRFLGLFP